MIGNPTQFNRPAGLITALSTNTPGVDVFRANQSRTQKLFLVFGGLLAALVGVFYVLQDRYTLVFPSLFLSLLLLLSTIIVFPRSVLYITVAAACLFELFPTNQPDALTDKIPYFANVNTIFQQNAGVNVKSVPLSLMEVVLVIGGMSSWIRGVLNRNLKIEKGPLFWPIAAYIVCVIFGFLNGFLNGGDYKIGLQESRNQVHLLLIYLIVYNQIDSVKRGHVLLWLCAICIAFKSVLYVYRQYVTLGGAPISDQGVGSHEEAFFFMGFVLLLLVLQLCRVYPKLRTFMWIMLPIVYMGFVSTNRRAGTAALVVGLVMVLVASYQCLPRYQKMIRNIIIFTALFGPVYYNVFKNSSNPLAAPARAIKSHYEPDWRDLQSNLYRDAENACQMATMRAAPIFGYGYGRPFIKAAWIADISNTYAWWDYLPHNQILWVWQRLGFVGFFAFWFMVCSAIIVHVHTARDPETSYELRAFHLFAIGILGMELMVAMYDMQLANSRNMVFTGLFLGMVFPRSRRMAPQIAP
jgi:hypothetical protein